MNYELSLLDLLASPVVKRSRVARKARETANPHCGENATYSYNVGVGWRPGQGVASQRSTCTKQGLTAPDVNFKKLICA